jgi:outer membrane protein assembly factor BamB
MTKLLILLSVLISGATDVSPKKPDSGANWPQFRGPNAGGIAEGPALPLSWNIKEKTNIRFTTEIPGLAHSSPIIWGDRLYLTTAISKDANPQLKVGLYGDGDSAKDMSEQRWELFCLDKNTGEILWHKEAWHSVPRAARHTKATHCNSTPATDGQYIVAFLGSEGLFCFDMNGEQKWRKDLGKLDAGPKEAKELQWGFASSPTILNGRVIVQCDTHDEGFVACFDLKNGNEIWNTPRRDDSTWSSPTVYFDGSSARVAVNGYHEIAGYDAENGDQFWKMAGGGDVAVPTPVVSDGLIYITNAHGGPAPLYAIHVSATGVLNPFGKSPSKAIAWAENKNGAYMQTPLVYGKYIYSCSDRGILKCYDAKTGKLMYQERLGTGSVGFTASPVAGDGKLYFAAEDGTVFVIQAGPELKVLATNSMDEICMASPAISDGVVYFRTRGHVVAVGKKK